MKTQEQIVARIKTVREDDFEDFFRVQQMELIGALSLAAAAPFLPAEVSEQEWKLVYPDDQSVVSAIADYLPFAYEKAYGQRGLSSTRSIDHFLGLSFLVDDDLFGAIDRSFSNDYRDYGLHILRMVDHWLQQRDYPMLDPYPDARHIPTP